jgi:hypothetical protein
MEGTLNGIEGRRKGKILSQLDDSDTGRNVGFILGAQLGIEVGATLG